MNIQWLIRYKLLCSLALAIFCSFSPTLQAPPLPSSVHLHLLKGFRIETGMVQAIRAAALLHGLHPALVAAVIHTESHFDPKARSSAGAKGLMQITAGTQQHLGLVDPFDPFQNIVAGSLYLSQLLHRFDGQIPLAIAAYNAGPSAVKRYDGIPPYRETERYVNKVLKLFRTYQEISIFAVQG